LSGLLELLYISRGREEQTSTNIFAGFYHVIKRPDHTPLSALEPPLQPSARILKHSAAENSTCFVGSFGIAVSL
jgi:hypothetical protein